MHAIAAVVVLNEAPQSLRLLLKSAELQHGRGRTAVVCLMATPRSFTFAVKAVKFRPRTHKPEVPTRPRPRTAHPAPWLSQQSRSFFIQTEPTPNPNSLKFLPGRPVLPAEHGTGVYFTPDDREKSQSPLAVALLSLEGVTGVFLGTDFITISKNDEGGWTLMKPVVFGEIMDFFAEGKPVMLAEPVVTDTTILDDDDEVVAMIKELLQERVRPAVQEDGGDIFYRGFDPNTGTVNVQLAGSCVGCPSSTVTLKNGVEKMLMHYIPEVMAVNAVEDEELKEVNQKEVNELEDRLKAAGVPFEP
ncbi:unnamed protein product [Ectocarpus sp. 12 AP-2014]